ncbi:hypothetical protein V8F20_005529 [Naviculisporaceae sp. PSN 640]
MGCVESKEEEHASEHLLSSFPIVEPSSSAPVTMGQPPPQPQYRAVQPLVVSSQFSSQHERLLLELLPFQEATQFREWLSSAYVQGSWNEFQQDFLAQNPMAPEGPKEHVVKLAKDVIKSKDPKYLVYHPEKEGWTPDDHHVRFIATLILDNRLKGLWSDGDWRTESTNITKAAFEVLSFLRAASLKADSGPPGYDE